MRVSVKECPKGLPIICYREECTEEDEEECKSWIYLRDYGDWEDWTW